MLIVLRKRSMAVFAAVLMFILVCAVIIKAGTNPLEGRLIVIDPGHGGIDSGAHFEGLVLEKDINLAIGLKLKSELLGRRAKVIMTREEDISLDDHIPNGSRYIEDLSNRVKIVNQNNAELLLSIHANCMAGNTKTQGPIVFYSQSGSGEDSRLLAECLQNRLNTLSAYRDAGISIQERPEPGDFFVLRNSRCPSAIIETGFISNEFDRGLLLDGRHQAEIAKCIANGLSDFFFVKTPRGQVHGNRGNRPQRQCMPAVALWKNHIFTISYLLKFPFDVK